MSVPATSDPSRVQDFLDMSAVLTGFQTSTLAPGFDPNDLKSLFLATADERAGSALVDQLLQQYRALKGKVPAQQLADALLGISESPAQRTALLARSIVKLWYVGSWYPLDSVSANDGQVISMLAYTGGLVWKTAQAHPMGYSEMKFGYWASPPPALSEFGTSGQTTNNKEGSNG
jgi:hypothetical protein